MTIALDYTQVDITDDAATFGTAVRTQFQNAQSDLGNRPEKASNELITGTWTFAGVPTFGFGFNAAGGTIDGQLTMESTLEIDGGETGRLTFTGTVPVDGNPLFLGKPTFNNRYFYAYLTTAETISDSPTYTVLPIDNDVRSDDLYSNSSGVITVNSDGWYRIKYNVDFTNTAGSGCYIKSIIEKDSGGGYSEVVDSEVPTQSYNNANYNRNASNREITIELSDGDKIRLVCAVMTQLPSSGSIATTSNLCSLSIEKL